MKKATIYNLMFFGTGREGYFGGTISGHVSLIFTESEFAILRFNEYGGLMYLGKQIEFIPNDSDVRILNDAILNFPEKSCVDLTAEEVEQWHKLPKYKLSKNYVSANVQVGDVVINVETGEKEQVKSPDTLKYYNRNLCFEIEGREHLHEPPMEKAKFLGLLSENPFKGWEPTTIKSTSKKLHYMGEAIVEGVSYKFYSHSDVNKYYVFCKKEKIALEMRSNISAPFYDTIDKLTAKVTSEYVNGNLYYTFAKKVELPSHLYNWGTSKYQARLVGNDSGTYFDKESSYHYNNAAIKLGLI